MSCEMMSKGKIVSLGNYYMTGKLLGKGNFARVEEGYHKILEKKVAVKIIDSNTVKEEYVLKNLFREARIMSKLNHPCITCLYETMTSGSKYFMITELAAGGVMSAYLKEQKGGYLTERQSRSFARQLMSAVAHMHACGVLHRDLKMDNIMLDASKKFIKIVDFGLSNTWLPNAILKTRCGSLEYAAPELFDDHYRYGPEIDLWSLGVILYGMLTGGLPFVAHRELDTYHQKFLQNLTKGFRQIHKNALLHCSYGCSNLIERLLQKDPKKRINIHQAIAHPWIRKPYKTLNLFPIEKNIPPRMPNSDASKKIKNDPYGPDGGILNIKNHRRALMQMKLENLWSDAVANGQLHVQASERKIGHTQRIQRLCEHENNDGKTVAKLQEMEQRFQKLRITKSVL